MANSAEFDLDNENSWAGVQILPEEKIYLAESEVRYMDKELWKAIQEWLEIAQETNERLASVRAELAEIGNRERPKQDMLRVKLY